MMNTFTSPSILDLNDDNWDFETLFSIHPLPNIKVADMISYKSSQIVLFLKGLVIQDENWNLMKLKGLKKVSYSGYKIQQSFMNIWSNIKKEIEKDQDIEKNSQIFLKSYLLDELIGKNINDSTLVIDINEVSVPILSGNTFTQGQAKQILQFINKVEEKAKQSVLLWYLLKNGLLEKIEITEFGQLKLNWSHLIKNISEINNLQSLQMLLDKSSHKWDELKSKNNNKISKNQKLDQGQSSSDESEGQINSSKQSQVQNKNDNVQSMFHEDFRNEGVQLVNIESYNQNMNDIPSLLQSDTSEINNTMPYSFITYDDNKNMNMDQTMEYQFSRFQSDSNFFSQSQLYQQQQQQQQLELFEQPFSRGQNEFLLSNNEITEITEIDSNPQALVQDQQLLSSSTFINSLQREKFEMFMEQIQQQISDAKMRLMNKINDDKVIQEETLDANQNKEASILLSKSKGETKKVVDLKADYQAKAEKLLNDEELDQGSNQVWHVSEFQTLFRKGLLDKLDRNFKQIQKQKAESTQIQTSRGKTAIEKSNLIERVVNQVQAHNLYNYFVQVAKKTFYKIMVKKAEFLYVTSPFYLKYFENVNQQIINQQANSKLGVLNSMGMMSNEYEEFSMNFDSNSQKQNLQIKEIQLSLIEEIRMIKFEVPIRFKQCGNHLNCLDESAIQKIEISPTQTCHYCKQPLSTYYVDEYLKYICRVFKSESNSNENKEEEGDQGKQIQVEQDQVKQVTIDISNGRFYPELKDTEFENTINKVMDEEYLYQLTKFRTKNQSFALKKQVFQSEMMECYQNAYGSYQDGDEDDDADEHYDEYSDNYTTLSSQQFQIRKRDEFSSKKNDLKNSNRMLSSQQYQQQQDVIHHGRFKGIQHYFMLNYCSNKSIQPIKLSKVFNDTKFMTMPIRAIACRHIDCFDLSDLFLHNSPQNFNFNNLSCPVCQNEIQIEDLLIDSHCQCIIKYCMEQNRNTDNLVLYVDLKNHKFSYNGIGYSLDSILSLLPNHSIFPLFNPKTAEKSKYYEDDVEDLQGQLQQRQEIQSRQEDED